MRRRHGGGDRPHRSASVWALLRGGRAVAEPEPEPGPDGPPPPSRELVVFLRDVGAALCRSGDASNRIAERLDELAKQYGAPGVKFIILPTGLFVRVGEGEDSAVDFAPISGGDLRLDQIAQLYGLVAEAERTRMSPLEGQARLQKILASPPRFAPWATLAANILMTLGLGLIRNPVPTAMFGYLALGGVAGGLRLLAHRFPGFAPSLPVAASMAASIIAAAVSGAVAAGDTSQLLVPALVTFLPGAALTNATIELAGGAIVSGACRLVAAMMTLLLLAFGIAAGLQLAGPEQVGGRVPALGGWAPLLGVAVLGLGMALNAAAPTRSLLWLLLVMYVVWSVQLAGNSFGSTLLGAFLGGAVLTPAAYAVQGRLGGPPAQVSFLPAFWLLVPGALGLTGVSSLVTGTSDAATGLLTLVNALVTVVAIALGVLVGSSLTRTTVHAAGRSAGAPAA
ncbi:threonine/serine ThrE exporter family protein [Actinomadura gamaensis]|uniref:Threonine/serine exporter ThrE family protein n=1 Tax=Actinomadura gamaensis TaxID=1763541 RepID=A0ABV9U2L9_9ACTN